MMRSDPPDRARILWIAGLLLAGCSADAELEVSPAELDFGSTESVLALTVRNVADDSGIFRSGVGDLKYRITQDRGWLGCSPSRGSMGMIAESK